MGTEAYDTNMPYCDMCGEYFDSDEHEPISWPETGFRDIEATFKNGYPVICRKCFEWSKRIRSDMDRNYQEIERQLSTACPNVMSVMNEFTRSMDDLGASTRRATQALRDLKRKMRLTGRRMRRWARLDRERRLEKLGPTKRKRLRRRLMQQESRRINRRRR